MGRLTYARLIARLTSLVDVIPEQFSGNENIQRREDLRAVLTSALVDAQAGLDGEKFVLTPGQLKHEVVEQIGEINHRFETLAPPVKKISVVTMRTLRNTRPTASTGVQKSRRSRSRAPTVSPTLMSAVAATFEEQEAATALLALSSRARVPSGPPIPLVDLNTLPEEHFLKGVMYTLDCLRTNSMGTSDFI